MSTIISNRIHADRAQPKKISPIIYGWHYEEIGMIGDGGLYAEMIRNRDFAESGYAPGMTVENGRYVNVPHADSPQRLPELLPELNCWSVYNTDTIQIRRLAVNEAQRDFAMEITTDASLPGGLYGVVNEGFFGMYIQKGKTYRADLVLSSEKPGSLQLCVISDGAAVTDPVKLDFDAGRSRHRLTLTAMGTTTQGGFLLTPLQEGVVSVHFASLFPCDTWDDGRSVFRKDILQNMIDFQPEFLRFPGGCIVHGVNVETMYHWKETIVDMAQRKSSWSKWQPHYMSNGIGYHEFYELCEYLGADAMYVAPSGLVCTAWLFRREGTDYTHPEVDVNDYVQDCLDAIEYAIGPVDSVWGKKRAERGHPEPFPLKYVSVGNEDFGPRYYRHYHAFYHAIRARYPQLKIVTNSIICDVDHPWWDDKRVHLPDFVDPSTVEIFDEHYYKGPDWIFENYDRFDEYDRNGPDLMCLELGIHSDQVSDVLYESIFLMMMEKNGDLNPIFGGRPLMRNWTFVNGELNPYYYHTNETSWKTVHFYAKKLFRDNRCDYVFPTTCFREDAQQKWDENTLFALVGMDSASGDLIVKTVNLSDRDASCCVSIGTAEAPCVVSTLVNTPELPKTISESICGGPSVTETVIDFSKPVTFPARSICVIRVKTK